MNRPDDTKRGGALDDPCGRVVRTMAGLSGEDKLAWDFLRKRAGWKFGSTFDVAARDIGADQGTTSDAGRARLKNLRKKKLVKVYRQCRTTGVWTISLNRPPLLVRADNFAENGGPGTRSFVMAFIEALPNLDGDSLNEKARRFCNGQEKRAQSLLRNYRRRQRKEELSARGH